MKSNSTSSRISLIVAASLLLFSFFDDFPSALARRETSTRSASSRKGRGYRKLNLFEVTDNVLPPPGKTSGPSVSPTSSMIPTNEPSVSQEPTTSVLPSQSPSESIKPSSLPSQLPSVSLLPSSKPSRLPSQSPSESSMPSCGKGKGNGCPSARPSTAPTTSSLPSVSPSVSQEPSISVNPSSEPSLSHVPSTSLEPSSSPSSMPTCSTIGKGKGGKGMGCTKTLKTSKKTKKDNKIGKGGKTSPILDTTDFKPVEYNTARESVATSGSSATTNSIILSSFCAATIVGLILVIQIIQ